MPLRIAIVALMFAFACEAEAQPSWRPFVTTINGRSPIGAAFLNERYGFVTTSNNSVYRTTDAGATWIRIPNPPMTIIGMGPCYFNTPANIFLGGRYESTDSGMTWRPLPQRTATGDQPLCIINDKFIDCTGRTSTNHAASWSPAALRSGECVTGNLDKLVTIWGGSSTRFGTIFGMYSSDGGNSWNVAQPGVEADYGYAFPFSSIFVRAGGDDVYGTVGASRVERSTDGGATWNIVYPPAPGLGLDDGLWGDACIVYTQMKNASIPAGLLRSTDLGASWQTIGGPSAGVDGRDDQPLCGVTTRGSVCFAIDTWYGADTLWKCTDKSIFTPILNDTRIIPSFADTLFIDECDSALLEIQTQFSACDYIRIQDLTIEHFAGGSSIVGVTPNKIIRTGAPDTCSAWIIPRSAGTYAVTVHLHYCSSDWSGVDTTFPLTVVVKPHPTRLVLDNYGPIHFGTSTLCLSGGADTLFLTAIGCKPLFIKRTRVVADSASTLDFDATTLLNDSLKVNGGARKVIVRFHPGTAGKKTATLIIETNAGDYTVDLDAIVLPDSRELAYESHPLRSPMCEVVDDSILIVNPTCRTMSVDSLDFGPPFSLWPNQLPLTLLAGDSVYLQIRFAPLARGLTSLDVAAHLSFYEPTMVTHIDTIITVKATGLPGTSADSVSVSSIRFDSLRLCETAYRTVTIYSVGCDSLPLGNISLTGDSEFTLTGSPPSAIARGDSVVLNILLTPTATGSRSGAVVITFDSTRSKTIPISATLLRAVRILRIDSVGTLALGEHFICERLDTFITVRNPSCDSVVITNAQWTAGNFWIDMPLPITIPSGGEVRIPIASVPDTAGGAAQNQSVLTLTSTADSALPPIPCHLGIKYPRPVHLWLDYSSTALSGGNTWLLKIKGIPQEFEDIRTVDLQVEYNSNLLGMQFLHTPNLYLPSDVHNFHFEGNPLIMFDADSTLAILTFKVFLTTETQTPIEFSSIRFNGEDSMYTGCVAIPFAVGASFEYADLCGHPTIRAYLLGTPPQLTIIPNPNRGEVHIESDRPILDAMVRILNVLGSQLYEGPLVRDADRSYRLPETIRLQRGSYWLEVSSAHSVVSRLQLVVE